METPTRKFILFTEGDKKSLRKAVEKAESLGAVKLNYYGYLGFEGTGVLKINEDGEYFTSLCTKNELLKEGYKEIFVDDEPENGVEPIGRKMRVWDDDEIIEEIEYVLCRYDGRYYDKDGYIWDNAQEIPTQKHIVECTDDQWEEIQNILNK